MQHFGWSGKGRTGKEAPWLEVIRLESSEVSTNWLEPNKVKLTESFSTPFFGASRFPQDFVGFRSPESSVRIKWFQLACCVNLRIGREGGSVSSTSTNEDRELPLAKKVKFHDLGLRAWRVWRVWNHQRHFIVVCKCTCNLTCQSKIMI